MFRNNRNGLSVYDPFGSVDLFNSMFFSPLFETPATRKPVFSGFSTDVVENENDFTLTADLPGFNKEDIKIEIDDGVLTINAERNDETEKTEKGGKVIYKERSYGSYKRSFSLADIEEDGIKAKYENGVLSLTLPKKEPVPEIESKKTINID